MKKIAVLTLALLVLAGCSSETYKTGLGVVSGIGSSKSATEESDGLAQADVTSAAITVDSKDKIVSLSVDTVQVKVAFDGTGTLKTDPTATFKTKKELGDDYGMRKASPIGKEWYEQMDAFETWATGKTVAEVTSMPTVARDENHPDVPDVADLATSCTMSMGDYLSAISKAAANLK